MSAGREVGVDARCRLLASVSVNGCKALALRVASAHTRIRPHTDDPLFSNLWLFLSFVWASVQLGVALFLENHKRRAAMS